MIDTINRKLNRNKMLYLKKLLLTFLFFGFVCRMVGQMENTVWYMGDMGAGVRFVENNGVFELEAITGGHGDLEREGSVTAVDDIGEVIFYSDGIKLYNNLHDTIVENLGGCRSAVQAAVATPVPNALNEYYIFSNTVGSSCDTTVQDTNSILYSRIIIGGFGEIEQIGTDTTLGTTSSENLLAIPKDNSQNFWLVASSGDSARHVVYEITEAGINLHSQSDIIIGFEHDWSTEYSHKQQKIAITTPDWAKGLYTIEFNSTTGLFGDIEVIDYNRKRIYDVEWSPDGSKLYYSSYNNGTLRQYNYNTKQITDLWTSPDDESTYGGGLKLGPDNKIYYITHENHSFLSVINKPNELGLNCDYQLHGIDLENNIRVLNLPQSLPVSKFHPNNPQTGIINHYTSVQSICNNILTVPNPDSFYVGDNILLIQMQGVSYDTINAPAYGSVTDYGSAGNYEFNIIEEIRGNRILLRNKITREYDTEGKVQLIYVPDLGNATVYNLTCQEWNGETGGVLAFLGDVITMEGNIDVSGKGFRGGEYSDTLSQSNLCQTATLYQYQDTLIRESAYKGEGIGIFTQQNNRGKGLIANAGGGGNNHNCGGGGGSNFGCGGFGGIWLPCVTEEDDILNRRGIGGASIDYGNLPQRLFMGGGGGAGHSNNDQGTAGADGGGIIITSVNNIITNDFRIRANGANAFTNFLFLDSMYLHDGGGAGGAGGTVLINSSTEITSKLKIEIKGGKGSSVRYNHGHGGGGSGGVLMLNTYPAIGIDLIARGGASGFGSDGLTNEATAGEPGGVITGVQIVQPDLPHVLGFASLESEAECDGTASLLALGEHGLNYTYSLDGENWTTDSIFTNLSEGLQTVWIKDECWESKDSLQIITYPLLENTNTKITHQRCDSLGSVKKIDVSGGKPPYIYCLEDECLSQAGFYNLSAGTYPLHISDTRGCLIEKEIEILDKTETLQILLPETIEMGIGTSYTISPELESLENSSYAYQWLNSEGLDCTDCETPIATPLRSNLYELNIVDTFGCVGTSEIWLKVKPVEIYIANVFSPNQDGRNDYFFVQGDERQVEEIINMSIFDRWGSLVFRSDQLKLNDEFGGWDGTHQGRPLNTQVFVYSTQIRLFDGTTKVLTGTVTLLP